MRPVLDALPTILSIFAALGVALEALRRVLNRRAERQSAEAEIELKKADAFKTGNEGWSIMSASWNEQLAKRDQRIENLEVDMEKQRLARETERVDLQRQIAHLEKAVGALRQQLRDHDLVPAA